ncbi:zinc finger, CCHC-type, retrotransposon gag domain protein [Tanacetum coccineum]
MLDEPAMEKVPRTPDEGTAKILLCLVIQGSFTELRTRGHDAANGLTWENFKNLLTKEYCRKDEVQKLESEFWHHQMLGTEVDKYTARFHELAKMEIVQGVTNVGRRFILPRHEGTEKEMATMGGSHLAMNAEA